MFLSDGVDSKNGANENRCMLSDSEIDKFVSLVSARKFFLLKYFTTADKSWNKAVPQSLRPKLCFDVIKQTLHVQ